MAEKENGARPGEIEAYAIQLRTSDTLSKEDIIFDIADKYNYLGIHNEPINPKNSFIFFRTLEDRDRAWQEYQDKDIWAIAEQRTAYIPAFDLTKEGQQRNGNENVKELAKMLHINPDKVYFDDNGKLHAPPAFMRHMEDAIEIMKHEDY